MTGRTVPRRLATAMGVYSRDSFRFAVEEAVSSRGGFSHHKIPFTDLPTDCTLELSLLGSWETGSYWTQLERGKGSALMITLVTFAYRAGLAASFVHSRKQDFQARLLQPRLNALIDGSVCGIADRIISQHMLA